MAMDLPVAPRRLVGALLILTAVTGLIDAVSYLRMGHVFVANMTGNVVFLGLALDPGSGLSLPAAAVAIGGFLAGAVVGGRLAVHLVDRPRAWLRTAFTVQAAILAVVTLLAGLGVLTYSGDRALLTTAALAAGFGLQNATVRRIAAADLTTTVLTSPSPAWPPTASSPAAPEPDPTADSARYWPCSPAQLPARSCSRSPPPRWSSPSPPSWSSSPSPC